MPERPPLPGNSPVSAEELLRQLRQAAYDGMSRLVLPADDADPYLTVSQAERDLREQRRQQTEAEFYQDWQEGSRQQAAERHANPPLAPVIPIDSRRQHRHDRATQHLGQTSVRPAR